PPPETIVTLSLHDALPTLGRRYPRLGQPVDGDVVENIVSGHALGGAVEDPSDEPVSPDIMIDDPRGQADRRILDPVQRLRPVPQDRKSTRLNSSHEWISYA